MEIIQQLLEAKTIIPFGELAAFAADRSAFGDDIAAGLKSQVQLRAAQAERVLKGAELDDRRDLLASEQRDYDGSMREAEAIVGLARQVEQRTQQRAFVPASQVHTATAPRSGLFGVELRALTGTTGAGDVITPAENAAYFFDRLAAQSVVLQAGARVIRTDRDKLVVPRVDTDPTADSYAQGGAITASDPGFTAVTAEPRKQAVLVAMANEVIADSSPDVLALLEMQVARALALRLDLQFIEGSGTPPAIRGLKNVTSILTESMGDNGAIPTDLDPFANAIGKLATANANATAILMHPRTWGTLLKVKEATGSVKPVMQDSAGSGAQAVQRAIYGVPVFLSSQIAVNEVQGSSGAAASSAYVLDMSGIVAVFRQDARIELDRSRLFNSDSSELRATVRADLVVPNASAVCRILGILA